MDFLKYILSAAAAITLTSCFSNFEPDIESQPVLCMNSEIVAGEPIKVRLTRTWRWSDANINEYFHGTKDEINVTDAQMTICINDGEPMEMECRIIDNGYPDYFPEYREVPYFVADGATPRPGDRIRMYAVSKKFGEATAEVTVPRAIDIDSIDITPSNVFPGNQPGEVLFDLKMQLWFTDSDDSTDYYMFSYGKSKYNYNPDTDDVTYISDFYIDTSHEPIFTEHVSSLESIISETSGYTIFTDRQISGRQYGLLLTANQVRAAYRNFNNDPEIARPQILLTLNAISPSYYNHVLSIWVANEGIAGSLGSIGLGEAVFAASNVSTHAGVVAARTPSTISIDIMHLLGSYDLMQHIPPTVDN